MNERALIIFIRKPELGKVKTRLAASIGDEKALVIYEKLLEHTRVVAQNSNCDKYLFSTTDVETVHWKSFNVATQIGGSLGEKMLAAFEMVFNDGYQKTIIIGSDCPQLSSELIDDAFEKLNFYDVVIGPANDGGYYLLGMKKTYNKLFANKDWGTGTVLSDTKKTIADLSLSAYELQVLTDVDVKEDVPSEWKQELGII
jgi:uncharacterized protein